MVNSFTILIVIYTHIKRQKWKIYFARDIWVDHLRSVHSIYLNRLSCPGSQIKQVKKYTRKHSFFKKKLLIIKHLYT